MRLPAYILLFVVAACLPLLGVSAVAALPCVLAAGAVALAEELLWLLGTLVRVKPLRKLDGPLPLNSKPL